MELTMDDAFAGGVCRCQHCGTIQTVPTNAATKSRGAAAKALYQKTTAGPQETPSGLAGLAALGGGSGSGLSGSGLSSQRVALQSPTATAPQTQVEPQAPARKSGLPLLPIAIVLAILALAGLAIGIFVWARGHVTTELATTPPNFAGVTINAASVIYLLDNSHSNDALFDPLKVACFRSLATLGPDRKFQVMTWDNDKPAVYPPDQMHSATPAEIDLCKRSFADAIASGNAHLAGPLKRALAQKPGALVIATGKWELDRDDLAALAAAAGDSSVHFYVFGLGSAPEQGALKLAAGATGGQYKRLSLSELNRAAE